MFKKIKHPDGSRELYFGKIKLLRYTNKRSYLNYKLSFLNPLQKSDGGGDWLLQVSFR